MDKAGAETREGQHPRNGHNRSRGRGSGQRQVEGSPAEGGRSQGRARAEEGASHSKTPCGWCLGPPSPWSSLWFPPHLWLYHGPRSSAALAELWLRPQPLVWPWPWPQPQPQPWPAGKATAGARAKPQGKSALGCRFMAQVGQEAGPSPSRTGAGPESGDDLGAGAR